MPLNARPARASAVARWSSDNNFGAARAVDNMEDGKISFRIPMLCAATAQRGIWTPLSARCRPAADSDFEGSNAARVGVVARKPIERNSKCPTDVALVRTQLR